MKYLTMVAALVFAGSAVAVDCTDCHEKIDVDMHVESEATIANCVDCHSIEDAHDIDMDLHTPDLKITECADCHEM